ncbi:hypothetical protein UPYG_G00303920 [Umbra pygmaea]|uniref:Uncharacterized protein n=1 Tax=Umbra pygmaea TaxID=75934 RepID=A0ABD0WRY6_UMBPY
MMSLGRPWRYPSKNCVEATNTKKRRRVQNPKIAEAVRRVHNSETNCRRYELEQGLTSPHNYSVTSYLLRDMSASPDLHNADEDAIVSACKTYYETVRRNFRYKQPDLALHAEAVKSLARSRARRKRLLETRQSVPATDEVDLWKCATVDLMSAEEDLLARCLNGLCDLQLFAARSSPCSVPRCSRDWRQFQSTGQRSTDFCKMDQIQIQCR